MTGPADRRPCGQGDGPTDAALDELALEGLEGGFLVALPRDAADRLLAEAIRINVPAGALVYRDDESPRLILVVTGLLRVFLTSADGRQVTVRYARSGDVAGLVLVIGGPAPMSIQAMTSALVVALRVDIAAGAPGDRSRRCPRLRRGADAGSCTSCSTTSAQQAFLPVRQRLVRQLLLLATAGLARDLVVHAGQQELADAIGSVREVVTRNLHQLHEEGLVDISRDEISIRDPLALAEIAHEPAARSRLSEPARSQSFRPRTAGPGPRLCYPSRRRGVAQLGSAPEWGSGGPAFESRHPDHFPSTTGPLARARPERRVPG